jgi:hypothetical protein
LIVVILWHLSTNLANELRHYAIYGIFGGLGAFLSVITGIRSIDFDIDLRPWEHTFAGATRIFIGVVGAVVMGLALDSHLIDPTFGHQTTHPSAPRGVLDQNVALILILTFVAGFSESLVPNLLRKGERASGATDQPKGSDAAITKSATTTKPAQVENG